MRTEGGDERAVRRGSFGKKVREEVFLIRTTLSKARLTTPRTLSTDSVARTFLLRRKKKFLPHKRRASNTLGTPCAVTSAPVMSCASSTTVMATRRMCTVP